MVKGTQRFSPAFSLVELLTVIAIMAILASALLVVIPKVATNGKVRQAQLQIVQIVAAIQTCETDYSRFPVSRAVAAATATDFTYGGTLKTPAGPVAIGTPVNGAILQNDQIIAVLMDFTNYPGTAVPTVNTNAQANFKRIQYLNAKMSGDTSSPGVGTDLVYRDPWGNPYIISLDLNNDGLCEDVFYRQAAVSGGGIYGLILQPSGNYAFHGRVMVWSAGPDGKINSSAAANLGENKDNVLSWR